jgi:hypothetical protein
MRKDNSVFSQDRTMTFGVYNTVVRISGIVAVGLMAVVDDTQGFHANDVWYGSLIAAMVIGPHALDYLAAKDTGIGTRTTTVINLLFTSLTVTIALARFL